MLIKTQIFQINKICLQMGWAPTESYQPKYSYEIFLRSQESQPSVICVLTQSSLTDMGRPKHIFRADTKKNATVRLSQKTGG